MSQYSIAGCMREHIATYRGLRQHHQAEATFRDQLYTLQQWQAKRMKKTHQALMVDPVYRDATEFFLQDVYGGVDLTQLTHDIERAMRAALKVLPDKVMRTSLVALELNTLSQLLDEKVTSIIFEDMKLNDVEHDAYIAALRQASPKAMRDRQVQLVRELGVGLDKYIRSRLIHATYKMVRKPAQMAGVTALYNFMGKGFDVMRPMGSASDVVGRIVNEEERLLHLVYEGHPQPYGFKTIAD